MWPSGTVQDGIRNPANPAVYEPSAGPSGSGQYVPTSLAATLETASTAPALTIEDTIRRVIAALSQIVAGNETSGLAALLASNVQAMPLSYRLALSGVPGINSFGVIAGGASGTVPTAAAGAAAGSGATVSVTGSSQNGRGSVSVTTGATGLGAGVLATVTWGGGPLVAPPFMLGLMSTQNLQYTYGSLTTTSFNIVCGVAPPASTTFAVNWLAMV